MHRCLARVYCFRRTGDRVRKIRTDITPYSHSSGLPLLFFFSDASYSRSVGRYQEGDKTFASRQSAPTEIFTFQINHSQLCNIKKNILFLFPHLFQDPFFVYLCFNIGWINLENLIKF